jgi:hypothetical protein
MGRRRKSKFQMEEALSLGDALSIRIIIFLLLVIFLVPLIQIGKVRLAKAKTDPFWHHAAQWVAEAPTEIPDEYAGTYDWPMNAQVRQIATDSSKWWLAWAAKDSVLMAVRRDPSKTFVSLRVEHFQPIPIWRTGQLSWSALDGEWFAQQVQPIPADDPKVKAALAEIKGLLGTPKPHAPAGGASSSSSEPQSQGATP